jgi:plasmid stability protein
MERTTISLPGDLIQRLRVIAAERRTSMAALIREALEEKVKTYRAKPRSLGIGASGHTDTARRTSEDRLEPRTWR